MNQVETIAQIAQARTLLQNLISQGLGGGEDHARLERRITRLKGKLAQANTAQVRASSTVFALASELNVKLADLLRNLPRGYGETTRLSAGERTALRTAYQR